MDLSYNPSVTPQGLAQLSNVNPLYALDGLQWLNRGQQADTGSLANLLASQEHEQRMNPLRERQLGLQNQTAEATLPGIVAESSMKQRQNKMGEATFSADVKDKLGEFAKKASDREIAELGNTAQRLMASSNPAEQRKGQQLWAASAHMMEKRQEWANELLRTQTSAGATVQAAKIAADSRLEIAKAMQEMRIKMMQMTPKDHAQEQARLLGQIRTMPPGEERDQLVRELEFHKMMEDRKNVQGVTVNPQVAPGTLQPNRPALPASPTGASPTAPKLAPQDAEALSWANANPNDPRAAAIKKRLGM